MGVPTDEQQRLQLKEQSGCEENGHSCNICGGCWCRQWAGACDCPRDDDTGLRYNRVKRELISLQLGDLMLIENEICELVNSYTEFTDHTRAEVKRYVNVWSNPYGDEYILEHSSPAQVYETLEIPREQ